MASGDTGQTGLSGFARVKHFIEMEGLIIKRGLPLSPRQEVLD